jgi:hypothetical protein
MASCVYQAARSARPSGPSDHDTSAAFALQANISPPTSSAQSGKRIHVRTGMPGKPFVTGKCSKSELLHVRWKGPVRRAYLEWRPAALTTAPSA